VAQIEEGADALLEGGGRLLAIGGDHTIALPLLRATARDTARSRWSTSTRISIRGTPTSGSASPTGRRSGAPGKRASCSATTAPTWGCGARSTRHADLSDDSSMGFAQITTDDVAEQGWPRWCADLARVGDAPVYVSVDIDVLDPAHAPGTGTPEAGGLTSRELLALVRGLRPAAVVGGDVVEVSPAYDHAEITAIAAAHVLYDLLTIMASPETA
jgi:agmatinase